MLRGMPDPTPEPQTSADFLALVQRAAADAEGCLTIPWGDLLDLRRQAFAEGFRRGRAPLAEGDKPPTLTPMARPDEPADEPPPTPGIVRTYTARTHVGACGVTTVDGEIRTFTASRPIAAEGGSYAIGSGEARLQAAGAWPEGTSDSAKRVWRDLEGVHAGQPTTLRAVLADLDALAASTRIARTRSPKRSTAIGRAANPGTRATSRTASTTCGRSSRRCSPP